MKILVLGGTGYIGSNISEAFRLRGYEVEPCGSKDINLEEIENVSILREKINNSDVLVICSAITRTTANDSQSCFRNIKQLQTIIESLKKTLIKNIVYLSAADVYGHGGENVTENTHLSPKNEYGIFKCFAEQILEFNKPNDSKLAFVRFSGVFGGINDTTSLIYRFKNSIRNNQHLKISNNGQSKRDYIPVEFLAASICELVEENCEGIFNISTGESLKIKTLLELIEKYSDKQTNIDYTPIKSDRDFDLTLCNKKLKDSLPYLLIPTLSESISSYLKEN